MSFIRGCDLYPSIYGSMNMVGRWGSDMGVWAGGEAVLVCGALETGLGT